MTSSFLEMSRHYVGNGGRGHEMIKTVTMIGNENKVAATMFQDFGNLIDVMDEVGLMLNYMAAESRTEVFINS